MRGTLWGALMGFGMGSVSGILSMHKTSASTAMTFVHPTLSRVVTLDTHFADGTVAMLERIRSTLGVEPSIRPSAIQQFNVILAKIRSFYNALHAFTTSPSENLALKIKTRKCATNASQAITNFEPYIWDSPEIQEVMDCFEHVRKTIVDKMLSLDSHH